ncbi:hypothetical protein AMES_8984 [Amycolatopsis mediterranei S699]|uniref:Uncharacterized protein n=2 Tax=Amycolatopsis mediterranei TaxID=33910 RepID=A0A0H3DIZ9_AMYMU|nr:hypothetical protein [Amycolatopsis mediterranei]ADJ50810.1 hypothetical protein AMED_9121 [Amycolatopsis mediterranei U32]AEK47822.1 hypothetical protein RAM_46785 [Amycolatopsis mediterranei S699]AFO82516.1 hypothetical protein AMES_8984 [Amycolatopsis mediterranei S699]AGT89645.1 hypothetical protein B737_8985 [Amycolatopsis mediterranei RB]KDO12196.1 hypothetical protein DV26_03855 [Amycolatopsis mediterranei]
MSEPKDPEQLLADALRAQAVFAPQVSPPPPKASDTSSSSPAAPASSTSSGSSAALPAGARGAEPATDAVPTSAINELPSAYGLLSGASADSLERERAALEAEAPTTFTPRPPEPEPARTSAQLPAYWILLLAVLLGLAAGSVVGLLTLV